MFVDQGRGDPYIFEETRRTQTKISDPEVGSLTRVLWVESEDEVGADSK
jgi:hypothetical protein